MTWCGWLMGGFHSRGHEVAPHAPHTGGGHGFQMDSKGNLPGCGSPRTRGCCQLHLRRLHLYGWTARGGYFARLKRHLGDGVALRDGRGHRGGRSCLRALRRYDTRAEGVFLGSEVGHGAGDHGAGCHRQQDGRLGAVLEHIYVG